MIKEYLKERKEIFEKVLNQKLDRYSYPKSIADGMRYAVLNGGKRIRPILLMMVLELYGKNIEIGYGIAVALEMIHSYSLVHDDLPALDNDDYRRGKLTTHKKFGEAEGILIGDALLTDSFGMIIRESKDISADKLLKIIEKISEYAGIDGMIGGQMVDIESEGKKVSYDTLKYIHRNKTGKMLQLPIEIGAIIAEADDREYKALVEYSKCLGMAFQIKDDILDIEGSFEEIGKPVGSDLELDKTTYPSIFGLEESKKILHDTIESGKKELDIFPKDKIAIFLELADYIGNRNN